MSKNILKEDEFLLSKIKPKPKNIIKEGKTIFLIGKGKLTLTNENLFFTRELGILKKHEEVVLDIPLTEIKSVTATKELGYDMLVLRYDDSDGVERIAKFSTPRFGESIAKLGLFALVTPPDPLFTEWSAAITNARSKGIEKREAETPINILKKRYARGEISKKEYEEMKKDLE